MGALAQDLRHALRLTGRHPGFTAAAVATLALGIGANTAIFTLINATLLYRLPFPDPGRLVLVVDRTRNDTGAPISYGDLADWQRQNGVFEALGGERWWQSTLAGEGGAERVVGASVTPNFFRMFGLRPVVGRDFGAEDDRQGAAPVVVLSRSLWQRRFESSPAVVGRSVTIGSRGYTVIGVMPVNPLFREMEVFRALGPVAAGESRSQHNSLYGYGRLKAGVPLERARAEMDALAERLERQYPESNTGHRIRIEPLKESLTTDYRAIMLILQGVVGFVLLIACANISNLLLARAAGRNREMAIRAAMGAGRGRILRQLLTESTLLGLLAAGLGLLFGAWCSDLLTRWVPEVQDLPAALQIDGQVLAFSIAVALAAGIGAGLLPALEASRVELGEALKEGGRAIAPRRGRLRDGLVAGQVALAFTLLIGAGLFLESLYRLLAVDPGFNAHNVLTLKLIDSGTQRTRVERQELRRRMLAEVRSLPGVLSAVVSWPVPLSTGEGSANSFFLAGRPEPARGQAPHADFRSVGPGYLGTMGIRLLKGREFAEGDKGVLIINQALARRYFAGEDPIGRRIYTGTPGERDGPYTVIGVAADSREYNLGKAPGPMVYSLAGGGEDLVVQTAGDPLALAPAIRGRLLALDRTQAVHDIKTVEQRRDELLRPERTVTVMLGMFAGIALLLAAVGIYGVIAYVVQGRTQEIGVRMALGAQPADVCRRMVARAMAPVALGLGAGLAAAFAVGRLLASLEVGVRPGDPRLFGAVAALVAAVGLLACYLPTRRAMRVDPVVALRHE